MKIFVPKETAEFEARVAAVPDSVRKLVKLGAEVVVEAGAGEAASFYDADYVAAGALIGSSGDADITLRVNPAEVSVGDKVFDMLKIPRISRAQGMDVLSSQANLAGYRAVIDAVGEYGRAVPMMMTAAGTVTPAKFVIIGAGVAGLQAIATARRLGGVVSAFDVRAAAKEQVESLGAKFVEVAGEDAADKSGYAREVSEEYRARQQAALAAVVAKSDIVITTALIPGKPAPRLLTAEMVGSMRSGSVIVDLAVASGGNVEGSAVGETVVTKNGVKILGHPNLASKLASDASKLYAQNLVNFLALIVKDGKVVIDEGDEIIKATLTSSLRGTK